MISHIIYHIWLLTINLNHSINYWNWDFQIMLGLANAARWVLHYYRKTKIDGQVTNKTLLSSHVKFFIFYFILFFLSSVRIGNELGASHPRVARFAVIVVVTTSIIISLIISALVLILKTPLSKLYTTSTVIIAAVANLTPLLSISIFLNGIQPILSGTAYFPFFFFFLLCCRLFYLYSCFSNCRGCNWEWMAGNSCIRKCRCILHNRSSNWMCSRV